MKGLAAVARLELERSWTLLPVSLLVGFLPFAVMPLLGAPFGEVGGMGKLLAILFTTAVAVLLGATSVANDLASSRLGFFFSRPLPWWAIWGGKVATALALTFAAGLLVLLPSQLFGNGELLQWRPVGSLMARALVGASGIMLALVFVVTGAAHWGAVALRARSLWIVLDVTALPLLVWAVSDASQRILGHGFLPGPELLPALVLAVAAAVHAAGAVQVAQGRTSATRSHAAASLTGWALLAVLALGWQVVSRTAFRVDPETLETAWLVRTSPSGDTGLLTGSQRVPGFWFTGSGSGGTFLVSPRGVEATEDLGREFAFSGDAQWGVWLSDGDDGLELHRIDVASGERHAVRLEPPPPTRTRRRAMIADETATRVAILQEDVASLYDAQTGQRLALLEAGMEGRVDFVDFREGGPDRVYRSTPDGGFAIQEITDGGATTTGRFDAPTGNEFVRGLHVGASGDRLLAVGRGEARLLESPSGTLLATFEGSPYSPLMGLLLSDGRILTAGAGSPLRVYEASGELTGELTLDGGVTALLETRPGRVLATIHDPGAATTPESVAESIRLVVIDVEPLRVVRVEPGLSWRPSQGPWFSARRDVPAGALVLVNGRESLRPPFRSALLLYDVETGERRWVAGTR